MKRLTTFYVKLAIALTVGLLFLYTAWRPKVVTVQRGYDGVAMEQNVNVASARKLVAKNEVPVAIPQIPGDGPKAGDVYQNVQVLGHLTTGQFTRLMTSITQWVSPEQGCNYCHNAENLASDDIYTKRVSRRMIQMTQHINSEWQTHVGETGVTCYTCHRGLNVPEYIWFEREPSKTDHPMRVGATAGQNAPALEAGLTSLPLDPYSAFLLGDANIRVNGPTALPTGNRQSIKQTEWTYALMMHMSNSLGVNCGYCHNTRAFAPWELSPPTRTNAWYGIRMVRALNNEYLVPLQSEYPEHRLGPTGDAPKQNCMTCHQGAFKPLLGARMLDEFPSLAKPGPKPASASLVQP